MTGIYMFRHKESGKCYVGKSKDIERRYKEHLRGKKSKIDKALSKEGLDAFEFSILCECKPYKLNKLEQHYIKLYDSYKNGYNQTIGGDTSISSSRRLYKN